MLAGAAARRPRRARGRARRLRPLRPARAGRHRRRARGGARADRRQRAWRAACSRPARRRLAARSISDRTAAIVDRLAMTIAAIWAVRTADRAGGRRRRLAQHRGRRARRRRDARRAAHRLRPAAAGQPSGARDSPQNDAWAAARTLGWAAALIIFAAAVTGYIAFATFLVDQTMYLSVVGSALYIADIIAQDGTEAILQPEHADRARVLAMAWPQPRRARADRRAGRAGRSRASRCWWSAVAAIVLGRWGVQSQDMFGARCAPPISALARRRHAVAVVAARRRRSVWPSAGRRPGAAGLARRRAFAAAPASTPASAIRSARSSAMSGCSSRRCWRRRSARPRLAEAGDRRRRAVGRHRLRPADDRQQFRLRPDPLVGARHPGRRLGGGRRRSGLRCAHQRPRDRDRDLRSRHADRSQLQPGQRLVKNWVHTDRIGRIIVSINVASRATSRWCATC